MRRVLAMIAVLGLTASACGGSGTTDAGPVPGRPTTTSGGGEPAAPSTTGPATTVAGGPVATTAAPDSAATTQVTLWFVRGETLESVTRAVPKVAGIGGEAMKALLTGPTTAESRAGLATAVPRDTRFLGLSIDDSGVAKVDLSRDFEAGGGSLGITLRLGQVACTLGQFPTVKGVRFALAGELVSVFSGDGLVIDKPVTCDSYRQVQGQPVFPGIWPFATKAELEAYDNSAGQTYRHPDRTAREFAATYVGMDNPVDFPFRTVGPGTVEVPIGPRYGEGHTTLANPKATFGVVLRQLGTQGESGPWTVVEATAFDVSVTTPSPLEKVTSPMRLTGQALAFEGNVNVTVREDGMLAGQALGRGVMTGGGDVKRPYSGDITFRTPTKPAGAVALTVISAADGQGILLATVVKVRF
jgi:hypothetical protein